MSEPLAITNARLWDGTGAGPIPDAAILVRDGRIEAAGAGIEPPEDARVLDAGGRFVMPGLVDMHVHLLLSGGDDALRCFLGAGVTTIRDLGGTAERMIEERDAIERGDKTGPRIFTYGPLLDGDPLIFGAAGPGALTWPEPIKTEVQGREVIEHLIGLGVDGVKLYAGLRPDLVRAMTEQVARRVPVAAHLGRTWASEAAEAGVDTLEHVHATCYQDVVPPEHRHGREDGNGGRPNYWTWLTGGWAAADLDAPEVQQFIRTLIDHDVALSPTMVLITNGMATTEAQQEPGLRYLPRAMREAREERIRRMAEMRASGQAPPSPPPRDPDEGPLARAKQLEFLRRLHEAGGRVTPSTDCGSHTGLVPGFSLHHELSLFAEAGIPNSDVLQAATRIAAEELWRSDDQGTIEAGKRADLLIVDGDPLTDIEDTRRVVTVVKDGIAHNPAEVLAGVET